MTSPTGWGERVPSPAFPVSCKMSFFNGKNDAGWPPLLVHTVCWKSCWILFSQLCLVSIVHVDHHFCDILLQFHKKHWMIYLDGNKMMHLVWDLGKVDSFVVQKWLYIRQTEVVQMPERVGPQKAPLPLREGMLPVAIDQPQWQEKTVEQKVTPKKAGLKLWKFEWVDRCWYMLIPSW